MANLLPRMVVFAAWGMLLPGVLVANRAAPAHADSPKIEFDVSYTVACRDVTPEEFMKTFPEHKVVEAALRVSAMMQRGEEDDVKELRYVLSNPKGRLRVLDYEPKTQVGSDVTDPIDVVEIGERVATLEAGVDAQIASFGGIHLKPSAGAIRTKKQNLQQKYSKLSEKELRVASGTMRREYAVFFKLRPSSQESLEGRKQLTCRFVVPKAWRGDYLYLDCHATSNDRPLWGKAKSIGSRRALVGLHMQADDEARQAVERLARLFDENAGTAGETQEASAGVDDSQGLFRRVPGAAIVESLLGSLVFKDDEAADREQAARESFRTAMEEVDLLAGQNGNTTTQAHP